MTPGARNACCLLAKLLMIWISCPSLGTQLSLFPSFSLTPTHTHTPLFSACLLPSACGPLARLASVDYSSLTAIMILHKQHLSAHLSLFPPGCPVSSIHLRSISASLPPGWKCMLPPQLKITPKSPRWYLRKSANVNGDNWCLTFLVTRRDDSTCRKDVMCFLHVAIEVSLLQMIIHLWSNVTWNARARCVNQVHVSHMDTLININAQSRLKKVLVVQTNKSSCYAAFICKLVV